MHDHTFLNMRIDSEVDETVLSIRLECSAAVIHALVERQ